MKKEKGFTLIELIVVIAIFGILAAITLAFLSKPGAQASDVSVKANLLSIRKQSEIYYLESNSYGENFTECNDGVFSDPKVTEALTEIQNNINGSITCNTSATGATWAISVDKLKSANVTWCVDSTGASRQGSEAEGGLCS